MVNNGDYGLATYSWDLNNKASANPATQKTSLLEVGKISLFLCCKQDRHTRCLSLQLSIHAATS